jgi:RNA polymerase sigma-70 factor, ECF subfamily
MRDQICHLNSTIMNTSESLTIFKLPDEEIIILALNGNKVIYEEIVKRYYDKLTAYLNRLLNFNTQDVEDCLSETFLKTYTHLTLYNQSLKFSSWLYRIAHNQAVDLIRKKSRIPTFNLDWFQHIPDKTAEYNITNERLESVLNRLPFKERNLLILFHIQELTLEEISDILKLKVNTVAVQLKRARIKAKQIIEKYKL